MIDQLGFDAPIFVISPYAFAVIDAPSNTPPPKCVLIFGGTFDPPHLAHAKLPILAAAQLGCDEVLYVPAAINPLKTEHPPTSKEHRLAMLLLAIADVPNAKISTIELDRPGPSYTIDTLWALADKLPHRKVAASIYRGIKTKSEPPGGASTLTTESPTEFRLLIGCDQALNFHQWKEWQVILMLATPAMMIRPPWDEESFAKALREKYSEVETQAWLRWTLRLPRMDISATDIRKKLAAGESVDGQLDQAVAEYIRSNGLYR